MQGLGPQLFPDLEGSTRPPKRFLSFDFIRRIVGLDVPVSTLLGNPRAWWETGRVERPAAKGAGLQPADGTAHPYLRLPNGCVRRSRPGLGAYETPVPCYTTTQ